MTHDEPPPIYFAEKRGGPGATWRKDPSRLGLWRVVDAKGEWVEGRAPSEPPETPATRLRHSLAGDWILDSPIDPQPVWGEGQRVLWPKGESLLMVGGIGTGKTTVAQQLVLHGIGALPGTFLGHMVKLDGVVGYVAADRPAQIRRSFRRMVDEPLRDLVNERMDVWSGALPFALDGQRTRTGELADFVQERGWDVLVLDSLKDVVTNTTDDDSGLRINQQVQECTARGIEVLALHHQRKAGNENRRPNRLDDVYGSRWLTAGAGSVILLWGDPGSAEVEMRHLKQPAEEVGPLALRHDHAAGLTTALGEVDITVPGKLTADALLAAMQRLGPSTLEALSAETGVSLSTVQRRMDALKTMGAVVGEQATSTSPKLWRTVFE